MRQFKRWLRHLCFTRWSLTRKFPRASLSAIEAAVHESEKSHRGEIRFAVECRLPWGQLAGNVSPRDRAIELFSWLRVWDTEHNNGVLIYLLIADRDVEIVADRGFNAKVTSAQWEEICRAMEQHFRAERFEQGALAGVAAVAALLREHFPGRGEDANELPDAPVIL